MNKRVDPIALCQAKYRMIEEETVAFLKKLAKVWVYINEDIWYNGRKLKDTIFQLEDTIGIYGIEIFRTDCVHRFGSKERIQLGSTVQP